MNAPRQRLSPVPGRPFLRKYLLHPLLFQGCLLLAACSLTPPVIQTHIEHSYVGKAAGRECVDLYSRLEQTLRQQQLIDSQAARIDGFPFLRVNRFLASYRDEKLTPSQTEYWLQQLARLDREARQHEVATLTERDLAAITPDIPNRSLLLERLTGCSSRLLAAVSHDREAVAQIRQRARVADNYNPARRIIGLYPFTALFVLAAVNDLHEKVQATFNTPLPELPVAGALIQYAPAGKGRDSEAKSLSQVLQQSADNPLSIPMPDAVQKQRLLQHFAPVWEIDTVDRNDRIGVPYWQGSQVSVDTDQHIVYGYLSHTRYDDAVLLQLNYTIWFPARPASGPFDILSGRLDGITWRVTLDQEARPLVYDIMHNCGCYHMFFPDRSLQVQQPQAFEEPLLVPDTAPVLAPEERIIIRIATVSHYVQSIRAGTPAAHSSQYALEEYRVLRNLPVTATRSMSLFAPDGIVKGTQRKERFLLWPMGVLDPGAMRQRGHHATAFVGRRHFDAARLIERYFEKNK